MPIERSDLWKDYIRCISAQCTHGTLLPCTNFGPQMNEAPSQILAMATLPQSITRHQKL